MLTPLQEALTERGYATLTDVQEAVSAPELAERDLLVSARTGSGKTVGFGLAIAPTLMKGGSLPPPAAPLALVVAPTRELALQVERELSWLYAKTGASVVSCIGGMDARAERRALDRGTHIVVGTPGRLRDHIERNALDLSDIRAIILDEADEMLDLGFREDLEYMLSEAPAARRTLLFSATVPPAIAQLAKSFQRDAERITTQVKGEQHTDIEYRAIQVSANDTEHAIINMLRFSDSPTAIIFANTRAAVARLTARLANRGFSVVSLSGELSQDERSHALQALRDGRAKVCVATDVAARGIDLPNLDLVIHADLPTNTEALLHRSGRTGRAGRKGISALIVTDRDVNKARRILGWAKISATWAPAPSPEEIREKDQQRLLSDPAWTAELTDEEKVFATQLLETHSPEQIAAACLRLYESQLSAPEELNAPMAKGERPERKAFGPSKWVALSVGRNDGAEPRWLLPLLLRASNIDKAQVGRIKVEDSETYVEVAEPALKAVLDAVDGQGVLEKDIKLRALDEAPESALRAGGKRDGKPGGKPGGKFGGKPGGRPDRSGPRPDRKPRDDARPPYKGKREDDRPARAPRPAASDAAAPKADSRPDRPRRDDDGPRKSFGKPAGKPGGGKPFNKSGDDKPFSKGPKKTGDKPFGKGPGKPAGKPFAKSADAKPAAKGKPRANLSDPSVSVRARGGDAAPKRKPRKP
ncbi:ATP-dependent RNA helicase DeaD [Sagittula marina]|uniref:ATP-dependent RNA helicase DeaD n=1 Tax=Sagittula marina TaxID=943940 RepID=A0A7W6DQH9_9RHOB|nr:DEAD/DEAH box helicase [Sagittula marina]MBB3984148.1 ATP-dependent RNA helicase DeaD [Sagittula marina]